MRDFTYEIYEQLLKDYLDHNYNLLSYENFLAKPDNDDKVVILRHDVDKRPENSLRTAEIERRLGATGTYYFRIVPESFDEEVIKKIADLGHEIGYHYEDVSLCRGNLDKAIKHFENGLNRTKKFYPVKTICMHGSPLSKWDNKLLWERYDYHDYGIVAEPYFDLDFNKVFYLTDTGREWNKESVSVRDRVDTSFDLKIRSTLDVMAALEKKEFPKLAMQNIHPQRWNDNLPEWITEFISQNSKNMIKRALISIRKEK